MSFALYIANYENITCC